MTALVPVLALVAGALMYALSTNAKLAELGRVLFAAGAFALCFAFAGKVVGIL